MNADFGNEFTEEDLKVLRDLNKRGFAVAVFTPADLDGADALTVEDEMIAAGWNAIMLDGSIEQDEDD